MSPFAVLWPTFALVALMFVVLVVLVTRRLRHVAAHPPGPGTFASVESAGAYFRPVEAPAADLADLFETPVLFLALAPLLLLTGLGGPAQVMLAWFYVAARGVHSAIQLGSNRVVPRFRAYIASVAVLSAMWIGFLVDSVVGARAASRIAGAFA